MGFFDTEKGVEQYVKMAEGYDGAVGTDYLNTFQLEVVPIPAAVWLFGSALFGLGWMRRKQS